MPFDALLKKYFAGVVLVLVSVAAYFQARGTTQLVGGRLGADEDTLSKVVAPKANLAGMRAKARGEKKSAEAILARNPFDSVTGPLNAQPIDTEGLEGGEGVAVDTNDPLGAPKCDGMRVHIVTESTDPTWSLAAIQGPGEPKAQLRRVGDDVKGKQVAYIGYNWREASPAVWMTQGPALCQALLFAEQPAPAAPKAVPGKKPPKPPRGRGRATKLPADIAKKIQKVSDTEYNVDRTVVDKILENQAELMRSARIVPEQKDGKVVGIRMFGIRPDTLLGHLGFQNGDRLESINGFDMTSPEKALEAYARLRTAQNMTVKVTRRGKPMSVDYKIK